jgi:hypothetical protein
MRQSGIISRKGFLTMNIIDIRTSTRDRGFARYVMGPVRARMKIRNAASVKAME